MDPLVTWLLDRGALGLLAIAVIFLWKELRQERRYVQTLTERYTDKLEKLHGKNSELAAEALEIARSVRKKRAGE